MNFKTDRLYLRPLNSDDKEAIFEYRSDSKANKYQAWIPSSLKDVELFIDKISKEINVPETWFQFAIIEQTSQNIIGDIGVHFFDLDNKQVEIGCTIRKNYHRQGYATESIKVILDYLIFSLKKHRVTASLDPKNIASIKLFEGLGFRKEAHFVESILVNGVWEDDIVYAILEKEWKSN